MIDVNRIEAYKLHLQSGNTYEKQALKEIDLEIFPGQFIGIIGHTGSGKSTLIQHLNGLMKATSGELYYNGENIYADGYDMKQLRSQVGLVFQYPEHQLFEVDVLTDVCFGPRNQGLTSEECEKSEKKLWNWWDFLKNITDSLRLSYPAGRKEERRLRECLPCGRRCLYWTSRRRAGSERKRRDFGSDRTAA